MLNREQDITGILNSKRFNKSKKTYKRINRKTYNVGNSRFLGSCYKKMNSTRIRI